MEFKNVEKLNGQNTEILKEETVRTRGTISGVTFPALEKTGFVEHGFLFRTGGVSSGYYESLNLSFTRGDRQEDVEENFRRAAAYFGTVPDRIVSAYQTHTSNVMRVGADQAGKGVTRERIYPDVDGLLTNEPGLLLTTSHADCTPVFLVDPVHRAIAMVHSGWRGTAGRIALNAIREMRREFGTEPADLVAAIGPCICVSCYEVGPEVAEQFLGMFGEETAFVDVTGAGPMLKKKDNGKYLLNQKSLNVRILTEAGVPREQISVSAYCTYERSDLFFSHRKMGEKRGNLRAFLMIRPEGAGGPA